MTATAAGPPPDLPIETDSADAVFEGGGVKGIAFVGALEAAAEVGITRWVNVAGTSAGAIVAALIAVGQAFLCSLAGFAFAKMTFRGRDVLFLVLVLTMTVPAQLAVIPQYMIISRLGWVDTLQALVVPGLVSAFGIFWMRQHISATISDELLQAARMDGANSWQIFARIAFPVVRPAAAVLGLLGFVNAWNDFLWPFIVLKSPDMYTAQIAIKALQSNISVDLGLAMAGSFLVTIPLLVLFAFFGKQMVSGIMDGAFKG